MCALRNLTKLSAKRRGGGLDRGEKYREEEAKDTAEARVGQVAEALFGHDLDIGCSCLTRNPAQLGESERFGSNYSQRCGYAMRIKERERERSA